MEENSTHPSFNNIQNYTQGFKPINFFLNQSESLKQNNLFFFLNTPNTAV